MHWLRFGLSAGAAGFLVLVASCREPTQITLAITTDVACSDVAQAGGVALRIGSSAAMASNTASSIVAPDCTGNGNIGTLAIIPSGSDDDQVSIQVVVASRSAPVVVNKSVDCDPKDPKNCIVAKRVLRYIPHTALSLPIHLSLKCAGVTCDDPSQTCIEGVCQGAVPECPPNEPCSLPPPSPDGGPMLDGSPPDVSLDVKLPDAFIDSPIACTAPLQSCNGKCVDLLTDSSNCGACGLVCTGTCVAGACKLATGTAVGDACIAVAGAIVGWTTTSAASWTERSGGIANKFTGLTGVGPIESGGGQLSFVGRTATNSLGREYSGALPPVAGTTFDLTLPDANGWVGRSDVGTQCFSYRQGSVPYVSCTGKFTKTPLSGAINVGPVVVGQNLWAVLLEPETPNAAIQPGTFNGTLQQKVPLAQTRMVTVVRGADQIYAASGTKILVSSGGGNFTEIWAGVDQVRGLRLDSKGTLYFVETNVNKATIRKLTYTGTPIPSNQSPILRTEIVDQLGPIVCVDVDDDAVYYMSGGAPWRIPK